MCNNPITLPGRAGRTPKRTGGPGRRTGATEWPRELNHCGALRRVLAAVYLSRPNCLAGVEVRGLQHVVHGLGVHAERPADTDRGKFTVVNQPVDRHLADPHQCCHLCNSQELRTGLLAVCGTRVASRFPASRWPVHSRHRNPISQAPAVPAASPPLAPTGATNKENSGTRVVIATGGGE